MRGRSPVRIRSRRWISRLRSAIIALALLAGYLCSGAAWKIEMLLRHPSPQKGISSAILDALRPYSSLPVGYALGPRFGRLAASLRLASDASPLEPAPAVSAARIQRRLVDPDGPWSDVAAFSLGTLQQRPHLLGTAVASRSFFLILDAARWGRTTTSRSPLLPDAIASYRKVAENDPHSLTAADSLNRLAGIQDEDWEFQDSLVCRLAAALLQPDRTPDRAALAETIRTARPELAALASSYCLYLNAPASERPPLAGPLAQQARQAGDLPLARWLGPEHPGDQPPATEAGDTALATWDGRPLSGAHVAMLQPQSLKMAADARSILGSRLQQQSKLGQAEIFKTLEDLNPARADDLLHPAGLALISPLIASRVLQRIPIETTDAGGAARLPGVPSGPGGLAISITLPANGPDMSLVPTPASARPLRLQFVPRVQVLPPVQSAGSPPLLQWNPYPGASSYTARVALELPGSAEGTSTAVSPEWDRRVLWWQDGIREPRLLMTPVGFVGPASDLGHNGLWVGDTYRVMVTAQDSEGNPLATSIGLQDHPEEFFTPAANWLGLEDPQSRVPAIISTYQLNLGKLWGRSRKRKDKGQGPAPAALDPLEQVLEMARAATPPSLAGAGLRQANLAPVAAHSPESVRLAPWPSVPSDGQGLPPLPDLAAPQLFPGAPLDIRSMPGMDLMPWK